MKSQKPKRKVLNASVLNTYQEGLKKVKRLGMESNLSETEVNNVMEECMQSFLVNQKKRNISRERRKAKILLNFRGIVWFLKLSFKFFTAFSLVIFVMYLVLQHKPIQYFVQSKLQDFIYPGMKILRKLFLPMIYVYPSLTDWYDESCLVVNPFFQVPDMPCPCEGVRAILNLTGEDVQMEEYHPGIPFLLKVHREEVSWSRLKTLYKSHTSVFDRDASHLTISSCSSSSNESSPALLFNSDLSSDDKWWDHTHVKWRCNRLEPTRLLRSIFGIPEKEPHYAAGVAIEKIIMIDGPKAPSYRMPTTDGTTVFIQQSSGSRMVVLNPANECKEKCSSVSVEMPPHHTLWFSWWYWRASSLPSPTSKRLSITYVGSYL